MVLILERKVKIWYYLFVGDEAMITIYLLDTENITEKDININIKSKGYKSVNSYIAYSFLRNIAQKFLNTDSSELTIVTTQNGKPYFKNYKNFHFSISHTNNLVAIAISDTEIGIDAELIRDIDLKIADRFFTEKEKEYIYNSTDLAINRFFELWTKKEAYIKQKSLNLSSLSSIDVTQSTTNKNFYTEKLSGYYLSVYTEKYEKPNFISINNFQILEALTNS